MKKILIPTLLTLATTPLISMVGCNHGPERIEIDVDVETEGRSKPTVISELFSIQVGTPYRFNVDISETTQDPTTYITFLICKEGDDDISSALYEVNSVIVNDIALEYDPDTRHGPSDPDTYQVLPLVEGGIGIAGCLSKVMDKTSIATIDLTFTTNEPTGKVFAYFANSST